MTVHRRTHRLSTRVTPSMASIIRAISVERGLSLSATIRGLIDASLNLTTTLQDERYYSSCPIPKPAPAADVQRAQRRDERRRMRSYLDRHARCERVGCGNPAVHVHHRQPKRMGGSRNEYLLSESNFEALCLLHHQDSHGIRPAPAQGDNPVPTQRRQENEQDRAGH